MSRRTYLILFLAGLILPSILAFFQPTPGYLDSAYYYAGGIQLATGQGFAEPYAWNYLDGRTSLPHPSHTYWFPLASIVAALGMWLTGQVTYAAARLPFIILAALVVPVTAALAYAFSKKRDVAILSALFAIFSVYHAPFVGVTDNFSPFMLFGGLYFLAVTKLIEAPSQTKYWFTLGLLAGLLALSRSDGLLWLGMTLLFALSRLVPHASRMTHHASRITFHFSLLTRYFLPALLGFLIIMSPWYARNLSAFGTLMAPGGSRALWLQNYDQTFIYPPDQLTKESFLEYGWENILADRMWALGTNLQSGFAAHGGIILFPFIVAGIIYYRKDERVKLAVIAWLILFFVMTFLFPFAGARGAFFHAGAALQPMWWTLAPLGLDGILSSLGKKNWGNDQTKFIFRSAFVMIAIILTLYVSYLRVFSLGWGEGEAGYPAVEQFLVQNGIGPQDIVIVRNAPGYYIATGRSALAIPYSGAEAVLAVAEQFGARYFVLEQQATLPELKYLREDPEQDANFEFLGEVNDIYIFRIER
ncbi:MAG TPA: hypothetical protein PLF42_01735 [Anaerolineales bacterium]|nr:hypothetical protein [Anaerolineales bacterium]